ncbi:hypothetical protein HW130_14630 [Streptomyces sp. PKU-EA00015]|uniref:hypothetical protein n=1 Tax=Streptomyces sp. PKU-EA00015 TaxID=2748326 RepID=UPI0015A456C3|nr:hypothetical protein [Streptomyces sp. PKU-EA00015]NWF27484.1 hypothetical protein [Streptomyces sp. PKU-EA00015]
MTAQPDAPLKSLTGHPSGPTAAEPAAAAPGGGAPKVVARQGVHSAVRPDQHAGDARYPVAWLHITAPGRGAIPTATSKCACGRDRSAVGHRKVHELIADHAAHRYLCPLRSFQEGRTAA